MAFSGYSQRIYECEICKGELTHQWVGSFTFPGVRLHDGPCWDVWNLATKPNTNGPVDEKTVGLGVPLSL